MILSGNVKHFLSLSLLLFLYSLGNADLDSLVLEVLINGLDLHGGSCLGLLLLSLHLHNLFLHLSLHFVGSVRLLHSLLLINLVVRLLGSLVALVSLASQRILLVGLLDVRSIGRSEFLSPLILFLLGGGHFGSNGFLGLWVEDLETVENVFVHYNFMLSKIENISF